MGSAFLFDAANVALVTLANPSMTLETVGDTMLLAGANRAMIGDELIQFGAAEQLGPALWRLSRLLRGRAGTAIPAAPGVGAPVVLLADPALLAVTADRVGGAAKGAGPLPGAR